MKKEINIDLPHNYKCRSYQAPFWQAMADGKKRAVLVWPRRNGKDKTALNFLITKAVQKVGIYYYLFPSYNQGRKILWDGMDKEGFKFIDHIPKELIVSVNSTEMKVLLRNGSLIQIVGVDSVDSVVGTNPVGCVFSEFSLQDPRGWEFIRPILAENGGWAVFVYTPRGSNHGKEIFDIAKKSPDWHCEILTADDTGYPSKEAIDQERRDGMSEDMIQQEFYCSFNLGVAGSYYAKYLNEARDDNRIGKVSWSKQSKVHTSWDIGIGDSTSIIFFQAIGDSIKIIDYYENSGEGFPHYATILKEKPYLYGNHYAPHDAESRHPNFGLSVREVADTLGIKLTILPTLQVGFEFGVEAVRGLFPRFYIDEEKCDYLIKCIENYRKSYNQKMDVYTERPVHDKWSHGCFIAGTPIATEFGECPIEEIKAGCVVKTPTGFKRVLNTFRYRAAALVKVSYGEKYFVCTPNHKVFTGNGLVYADALRYNDVLFTLEDNDLWKKLGMSLKGSCIGFRENFLLAKMKSTSYSEDISSNGTEATIEGLQKPSGTCIRPFGRYSEGSCQKDGTCTTKTGMLKITLSKIWRRLAQMSTRDCICRAKKEEPMLESQSSMPCNMQRCGMEATRVKVGIKNTQKKWALGNLKTTLKDLVRRARGYLSLNNHGKSFVIQIAKSGTGIEEGSTLKKENVLSVLENSNAKDTTSPLLVVNSVPMNPHQEPDVYDFEVEDDHCYYANGILVSNSDALRYLSLAVKLNIDSKGGPNDDDVNKMLDKYQPRFA